MTHDVTIDPELTRLGDALEQSAAVDRPTPRTGRRLSRRRVVPVVALVAVVATGASIAAVKLTTGAQVAASIPAGTLWLAGTEPSCTVVKEDVEYHCVLTNPPSSALGDWNGTVEPTVDASKHVNGGCRSLASDGMEWQCYLGEAAVQQQIIGQGFLGQYAPTPGVG